MMKANSYSILHPCALCKRTRGDHKAQTLHCPMSAKAFTHFHKTQTFQPKPNWKPKTPPFIL